MMYSHVCNQSLFETKQQPLFRSRETSLLRLSDKAVTSDRAQRQRFYETMIE